MKPKRLKLFSPNLKKSAHFRRVNITDMVPKLFTANIFFSIIEISVFTMSINIRYVINCWNNKSVIFFKSRQMYDHWFGIIGTLVDAALFLYTVP